MIGKPADAAVIAVIVVFIVFISFQVYANRGEASQVRIDAQGEQWIYSLEADQRVMIPGPLGDTEVVIKDGQVHIPDSPCRNKICVTSGLIHRVGQWLICLPNDVFIRVEGEVPRDQEVDDVAF